METNMESELQLRKKAFEIETTQDITNYSIKTSVVTILQHYISETTRSTVFSNYKPQKNLLNTENQNTSRNNQLNCKGCLASYPLPCQWHKRTGQSIGSVRENRKWALRKYVFTFIFLDVEQVLQKPAPFSQAESQPPQKSKTKQNYNNMSIYWISNLLIQ